MELLIILGLILLNGLLSMTEMAMVSSRKTKLEAQANKGNKSAQRTLKLLNEPDKFLSTIQIGITLIGILTGIFSGESAEKDLTKIFQQFPSIAGWAKPLATTIIVIVVTYFTLILGELLPKRLGLTQPEKIAKKMLPVMNVLNKIIYPFAWILSSSTQLLAKLFHIKNNNTIVTEEEIKAIIQESAEHGEIEVAEQEIIERVFHLGDRNITSLMTHRNDIDCLYTSMSAQDATNYIRQNPRSVYPLCEENIDRVIGIVRTKDLFSSKEHFTWKELARPALFVPENNSAYKVMELFKKKGIHTCFVIDEYGSLQGMVTLKNIFEAIVGDMPEVDDTEEKDIIHRTDGSYWVNAKISFYEFLDYFDYLDKAEEEAEKFDILAGFVLDHLEHIPLEGEGFKWKDFEFEVADMDGQRIDKVLVKFNFML